LVEEAYSRVGVQIAASEPRIDTSSVGERSSCAVKMPRWSAADLLAPGF
jgi:hypothetical protein